MTKVRLSERLLKISSFVDESDCVADIGADHGYLALFLAQKFNHKVYASEYGDGPYSKLLENIHDLGGEKMVECYQADGLNKLRDDVDTLIIAGMGGKTIAKILNNPSSKRIKKVICEPQSEIFLVRDYFINNDFKIVDEVYVTEKEKAYPVIVAKRGNEDKPYEDYELEYGRVGIMKKDQILKEFLERQIAIFEGIKAKGQLNSKSLVEEELAKKALCNFFK